MTPGILKILMYMSTITIHVTGNDWHFTPQLMYQLQPTFSKNGLKLLLNSDSLHFNTSIIITAFVVFVHI
jgi:hypothetical protein